MKSRKRWTAAVLCTALLAGVSGCGDKEEGKESLAQEQKGRYVETQAVLPEELEDWTVKQLFTEADALHLLAAKQEGEGTILREWAGQGGDFVDVTQEWLKATVLPCGESAHMELLQGGGAEDAGGNMEETQYLFARYAADGEEDARSYLWKEEGDKAREITPEKWTVQNEEWGMYEYVAGVEALDNGTLAVYSYLSMDLLSGEDGSLLGSEPITSYYGDAAATDGKNVYLCTMTDSGSVNGFEKRPEGKEKGAAVIPFSGVEGNASFCALEDGTLIAAGSKGLFRCQAGGTDWEKLADGMETDFGLSNLWCTGLAALEDGKIFALMQVSGGGVKINQYEYDPDAVIEVKENLRLYTVHDSYLLNQAAAVYHRRHPEVLITIEYTYPRYYYEEADYNAVYQELNTMLMGDEAPDILVMDHLDIDSYADKGLLADLGDVVDDMEENGTLLSGITSSYVREDGRRYVVPLQFGFNIAMGRDIAAENMESMETLADFLSKADYSYLGNQTTAELVDKFYPYFCGEIISGSQLDREALGKYLEYLKAIADNSGMISARGKDEKSYNMWDLADQAKLAFEEADGFKGCLFPMAIRDYIKGEFTAFEGCFIPSVQAGICTKSRYLDTAKDFLRYALSEEIQDTDYYSGFPVNYVSLEKQSLADRSEAEAETAIMVDGASVEFKILDYPQETAEELLTLCRTLDKPVMEDRKVREVLIEALEGYLTGSQSKEETIEKVEGGLKMYLAE